VAAKGLVDQRQRQGLAGRIVDQARDLLGLRALGRGLPGRRLAQQGFRPRDGPLCEVAGVDARGIRYALTFRDTAGWWT
jgi:hypothetical protein